MKSGTWSFLKEFPGIVSEGFRLAMDAPRLPELRHDPDGVTKLQERRARDREWNEALRRSGHTPFRDTHPPRQVPATKAVHLQWHDRAHDVWKDTTIWIDLEKVRIYQCAPWMLGRQYEGSGAIGVVLLASPVLLLASPYLKIREHRMRATERREGMSRHAILLMQRLKDKLGRREEALLREALKNEWAERERVRAKFARAPSFDEARELLGACELRVRTLDRPTKRQARMHFWIDEDGDVIGKSHLFSGEETYAVEVKNVIFRGKEAEELLEQFETCVEG